MPVTRWPPSSSPIFRDRSKLMRRPGAQAPKLVRARVSAAASTWKTQPPSSGAIDTAVRHGPEQAIDAPSAMPRRIVGAADRDTAQVARPLDGEHRADNR